MRPLMKSHQRLLTLLSATVLPIAFTPHLHALPLITNVVETGGDNEATDTVPAKWTGVTFVNGVANEPVNGTAADAPYTVGLFGEDVPMFVDRNHQWNGATTTLPIPKYLEGGEYILSGNDNRDNAEYSLAITISEASYVYMLIDDRLGDASNANPPNFPDWTLDRTGDGLPDMAWIVEEGWQPMKTGANRFGNPDWPDHIGADEGGDGVGAGNGINQWASIYVKRFPAGTFTIGAPNNNGQNMYGVVIKAVPRNPVINRSGGDLRGFRFEIVDGSITMLNPSTLAATLDGVAIPAGNLAVSKTGDTTTIEYVAPALLPSGTAHRVELTYGDNATPALVRTEVLTFTVETYATLTADLKVTPDTSKPGFLWRVYQNTANQQNSITKAEKVVNGELRDIAGALLPNLADPNATGVAAAAASAPNPANGLIEFEIPGVLNLSQIAGEANGNFPDDGQMPGVPGIDGSTDGVVAEVLTYIELPAGLITMGVNSDDGFSTTAGLVQDVARRLRAGVFDGSRGAADTLFRIEVKEAGVYAFRTLWQEGNGGANIEWFTVTAGGQKVLLNDTANGGFKAYRAASGLPSLARVRRASPIPGAVAVPADATIEIEIVDGTAAVASESVVLKLNGVPTKPSVTKAGNLTRVVLLSSGFFPSASTQAVELTYAAGGAPVTSAWTFRVDAYQTLSTALVTPVGSARDRGFRIRTVQSEAARATTIAAAEQQLLNNNGAANIADTFGAGTDGFFLHTGVINFNQDAPSPAGNFNADGGFEDMLPPGIPGTLGGNDNYTVEVLTFLEFPAAGFYTLGVNSDDGFKVTSTTGVDATAPTLGSFDGGRGVADSLFNLGVPQAGVYPFRLIWFEGTGGSAAEWFTVTKDGYRVLVNADTSGALKAYQLRTVQPTPTIQLGRTAAGITVTFTGTLQSAENITGPFTDVAGATSPYTADGTGGARYFRSR